MMMGKTEDNVGAAFAGESQANRRYLFFAEKADTEGYPQIAKLFRAVADAETIHAKNHLKVLDEIGSTSDNLSSAIDGESYEYTTMYPEFIKQAEEDGNQTAKRSFDLANQVEQIHHKLFQTMLSKVNAKDAIEAQPIYVCQVCGYTVEGEAPDRCPVCGAPVKMFKEME
jgi:rubrerythrin